MYLIVNKMMQLEIVHMSDRYRRIEELARTAVPQTNLAVAAYRHALPELSVLQMASKVIQDLWL